MMNGTRAFQRKHISSQKRSLRWKIEGVGPFGPDVFDDGTLLEGENKNRQHLNGVVIGGVLEEAGR